jgi:hypothetical protein
MDLCGENCESEFALDARQGTDSQVVLRSPEFGINTWEYQEYEDPGDAESKPLIIPLEDVQCQISRGTIEHTDPILWMTTTMDRVSNNSGNFNVGANQTYSSPFHFPFLLCLLLMKRKME